MVEHWIAIGVALAFGVTPVVVAAGGADGGSTEVTQILNNVELAAQTLKQARIVAEQINTVINTGTTVMHGITNLKNLPYQVMDEMLAPYKSQVADLQGLLGSVNGMKAAAQTASYLMTSRMNEASSMKLSLGEYMKYEVKLAVTKGGVYRQRFNQDIAAIDNLQVRAKQLVSITEKTKAVSGNVEGLQLLNQQATLQAGELMEIKAALLSTNADRNQEAAIKEDATSTKVDVRAGTVSASRARTERDKATTYTAKDPWRVTWPGMESTK